MTWPIIVAFAFLFAIIFAMLVLVRLARIQADIRRLRQIAEAFRNQLPVLGNVLQAQESAIQTSREAVDAHAETILIEPEAKPR